MEAMLLSSTPDQSISPYKHNRNPRKINTTQAFISRPSENFAPPSYIINKVHGGGLIGPPPSRYSSLPSSVSVLNQQQQLLHPPPLLPLPISMPYSSLPTRNSKGGSGISTISSPTKKKITKSKTRGLEVTPKKSKSSNTPKQDEKRSEAKFESLMTTASTIPSGPDPCDLPKKVSRVLKSKVLFRSDINNKGAAPAADDDDDDDTHTAAVYGGGAVEELACSIFSLAPPPSSLPFPKFSLKPKLGCNVEAGVLGVDAGATDSLRRLLRLR